MRCNSQVAVHSATVYACKDTKKMGIEKNTTYCFCFSPDFCIFAIKILHTLNYD